MARRSNNNQQARGGRGRKNNNQASSRNHNARPPHPNDEEAARRAERLLRFGGGLPPSAPSGPAVTPPGLGRGARKRVAKASTLPVEDVNPPKSLPNAPAAGFFDRGDQPARGTSPSHRGNPTQSKKPNLRDSHGQRNSPPRPGENSAVNPASQPVDLPSLDMGDSRLSPQERFEMVKRLRVKDRAASIANGTYSDPGKQMLLKDAITPVGTCKDMCPQFERVRRWVQHDIWREECDPHKGNPRLSAQRVPDERKMVKKFTRPAAGMEEQLPSDLRPPGVLKHTLDYLFNNLIAKAESFASVHHFVWDRTRAVRNDFSIQQVSKAGDVRIAYGCFERIARFHLVTLHHLAGPGNSYGEYDVQQEREQFDKTMLSLMQYYGDFSQKVFSQNETEFRAYQIVFTIQSPRPNLEDRLYTWDDRIRKDPLLERALDIHKAALSISELQGPLRPWRTHKVAQSHFKAFWELIRSPDTPYLMGCMAEIYFPLMRFRALSFIWRAYRPRKGAIRTPFNDWSLEDLQPALLFETNGEVESYLKQCGFATMKNERGTTVIDLNSVTGGVPDIGTVQPSSTVIERKRQGVSLTDMINGVDKGTKRPSPQEPRIDWKPHMAMVFDTETPPFGRGLGEKPTAAELAMELPDEENNPTTLEQTTRLKTAQAAKSEDSRTGALQERKRAAEEQLRAAREQLEAAKGGSKAVNSEAAAKQRAEEAIKAAKAKEEQSRFAQEAEEQRAKESARNLAEAEAERAKRAHEAEVRKLAEAAAERERKAKAEEHLKAERARQDEQARLEAWRAQQAEQARLEAERARLEADKAQLEADRAQLEAERAQQAKKAVDTMTTEYLDAPGVGVFDQFIEYVAKPMVASAREARLMENIKAKSNQLYRGYLSRKYLDRWRKIAHDRRFARLGREQRLRRRIAARIRQENQRAAQVDEARARSHSEATSTHQSPSDGTGAQFSASAPMPPPAHLTHTPDELGPRRDKTDSAYFTYKALGMSPPDSLLPRTMHPEEHKRGYKRPHDETTATDLGHSASPNGADSSPDEDGNHSSPTSDSSGRINIAALIKASQRAAAELANTTEWMSGERKRMRLESAESSRRSSSNSSKSSPGIRGIQDLSESDIVSLKARGWKPPTSEPAYRNRSSRFLRRDQYADVLLFKGVHRKLPGYAPSAKMPDIDSLLDPRTGKIGSTMTPQERSRYVTSSALPQSVETVDAPSQNLLSHGPSPSGFASLRPSFASSSFGALPAQQTSAASSSHLANFQPAPIAPPFQRPAQPPPIAASSQLPAARPQHEAFSSTPRRSSGVAPTSFSSTPSSGTGTPNRERVLQNGDTIGNVRPSQSGLKRKAHEEMPAQQESKRFQRSPAPSEPAPMSKGPGAVEREISPPMLKRKAREEAQEQPQAKRSQKSPSPPAASGGRIGSPNLKRASGQQKRKQARPTGAQINSVNPFEVLAGGYEGYGADDSSNADKTDEDEHLQPLASGGRGGDYGTDQEGGDDSEGDSSETLDSDMPDKENDKDGEYVDDGEMSDNDNLSEEDGEGEIDEDYDDVVDEYLDNSEMPQKDDTSDESVDDAATPQLDQSSKWAGKGGTSVEDAIEL